MKKLILKYICPKCKNRSKFLIKTRNTFVGLRFTTDWYTCENKKCNFTFPKNIKIKEELRGVTL